LRTALESTSGSRSQILYNLGLCLWQLTYDKAALAQMFKSRVVEPLVELLKQGAMPPTAAHAATWRGQVALLSGLFVGNDRQYIADWSTRYKFDGMAEGW
jgi:hypothetical protein